MMIKFLQLFAEGAEGTAGTADSSATETSPEANNNSDVPVEEVKESNPDAEFESLVAGKFKDQYEKKLKAAMDRRFKKADAAEKYNQSVKPLVEEIAAKYGITDGNVDAILTQFRADKTNYEAEALEKGIPVDAVRQMRELERQNRILTQARDEAFQEQQRRAEFNRFMQQADEVKQKYPAFNVENEMNDSAFMAMIHAGVSVENAYVARHSDEILSQTIPYAINKATEKVTNAVKANGKRVLEGGAGNAAPAAVSDTHKPVSEMNSDEIKALVARALSGEKIRL